MKKSDIEYHGDWGRSHPAVNVKVDAWQWAERYALEVARDNGADEDEAHAFALYCEGLPDDTVETLFGWACESRFDDWQWYAREVYGDHVKCYTAGRCGGWVYIDQIRAEDVDGWDAIELAKWARVAAYARTCADDVPYTMANLAYQNHWERECEIRAECGDWVLRQFAGVA